MSFDLAPRAPYLLYVVLLCVGAYMILSSRNLLRAIVGLYLVQSSVVLFFILVSVRAGGGPPIVEDGADAEYHDPLPHALMLTAIVVGVATLGLALALLERQQRERWSIRDAGESPSVP